jgi:excisionase family DNA binding protein
MKQLPTRKESNVIPASMLDSEIWLSTRVAAQQLSCSLSKVQKMVEAGELAAWKTSGGHRRIPQSEIERILSERPKGGTITIGPGRPFRILIAEDDRTLQKVYATRLMSWRMPIELIQVHDGYAALITLAKRRPELIIMDLRMPNIDGFEAIRTIRADADFARTDIIVVSALPSNEILSQLPSDIAVFKKPIDFAQLQGFVQACIAQRRGPGEQKKTHPLEQSRGARMGVL